MGAGKVILGMTEKFRNRKKHTGLHKNKKPAPARH